MIESSTFVWDPEKKEISIVLKSHDAEDIGQGMIEAIMALACHLILHKVEKSELIKVLDNAELLSKTVTEELYTETGGGSNATN